jgi:hypothetical protein
MAPINPLARKREQAQAEEVFRANNVPLTWGDFNQRLLHTARRRAGFDGSSFKSAG